uniref:putative Ig domain-containing protein n=1 Tax=Streptococcus tangpeifui TaxID=2709400 RepID=UPI00197DEEB1
MKHSIKEKQRFSIRKRKHIGAGSVLLGLTLLMMSLGGGQVQSDDVIGEGNSSSAAQVTENPVAGPAASATEDNQPASDAAANQLEKSDAEQSKTRTVTITYTVVYVNGAGQEIYRTTKAKTITIEGDSPASLTVTENGSADLATPALVNYELAAGPTSQVVTENADNTVTVQVKEKAAEENKVTEANSDQNSESATAVSSVSNVNVEKQTLSETPVAQSEAGSNQLGNPSDVTEVAKPAVELSPEESQLLVRDLLRASMVAANSLDDAVTVPGNPADAETPSDPEEVADISGTGISKVNFYNEDELVSTQYVKSGDYLLEPNVPESGDKAFKGWLYNGQILDFTKPVDFPVGQEVTVTANYSDTVRVTFKNDDGIIVSVKEIPTGSRTNANDVAILSPKDSFIFSHWSTSPNGSDAFDFSTVINKDTTLYAVIKNQKTISFDSNGGTPVNNVYVDSGSLADNLGSLPVPTRQGYNFKGWVDSKTGQNIDETTDITRDYRLQAQWEAKTDTPYMVVHWIENPTGQHEVNGIQYTVGTITNETGRTDEPATYTKPDFFSAYTLSDYQPEVGVVKISGDGQATLNVYYERRKYDLTVDNFGAVTVYQVKWGEPLTQYLENKGVPSWSMYNRDSPGGSLLARTNYPMPAMDTTVRATSRRFSARPNMYYIDIDTGETFYQQQINSNIGATLNLSSNVEGYDFVNFAGQPRGVRQLIVSDSDIWAYFKKKTYNVAFITDSDIPDSHTMVPYKSSVTTLVPTNMTPYVTKKTDDHGINYVFTGWYDNAATSGNSVDFSNVTVPAGGLVYYAGWTKEYVEVTVHRDTTLDKDDKDKYVLLVSSGNNVLNTDNKYAQIDADGHSKKDENNSPIVDNSKTFNGKLDVNDKTNYDGTTLEPIWYKLVNGRLEKANLADEIIDPGTILVPVWEYKTKTVVYNANGGSQPPATEDLEFMRNVIIAEQGEMAAPSQEYVFTGWNTQANGSGKTYRPKDLLGFNQFSGDSLTLYAQWRKNPDYDFATVTYNPNGGNGSVVSKHHKTNSPIYIRNQGYSRPGYNLLGWSTKEGAKEGDEQYATGAKIPVNNQTLYAVWTEKLAADVVNPNILTDKTDAGDKVVVTPNKENAMMRPSAVANGLSVDSNGHLVGQADVKDWSGNQDEERNFNLSVTIVLQVTRPNGNSTNETITVNVPVTIQRDTDGDSIPDVNDSDDDNDGLPDDKDKNPKSKDTEGPVITADDKTVTERTPFEVPVSVTDNDDPEAKVTEITGLPKGVNFDEAGGKISGSAGQETWSGDSDEVHTYPVTLKATDGSGNESTKEITITVQRDSDGDGTPDVNDPDDDNDGLPDDKDKNPKSKDTEGPVITADDKTITEKTSFEVPVSVTDNDDSETKVTEVTGLPKGVNFDEAGGKIAGSADQETWSGDTDEVHTYPVTIKATDGSGNESTKQITITVQRDTDGDGISDVNDSDDDNDGLPDDKDNHPKSKDAEGPVITADDKTVTEKTPFEVPVSVTDNDDPAAKITEVTGLPKGVDFDGTGGKISGSADQEDWSTDQDEVHTYPVTIKAIDGAGNESTKEITITVQRDTDGDGTPDVNDSDDDNDSLPDAKDKNSKGKDTESPVINADDKTVTERTPFEVPVSVTDNDDPDAKVTEVTGLPKGVNFDEAGSKISGSADQEDWSNDQDEAHTYPVTLKATDGAGNESTKQITITVQRDSDGDGDPDVTDPDDDNDGLPDDKDKNPKSKDTEGPVITADDKMVTEKTSFEIPVSVTDNDDPDAKVIEVTGLPKGVDYDSDTGKISGSADQEDWSTDQDEVHTYPVTLKATDGSGNEGTKEITITVQRDTDGDGTPDVNDSDDDNDGLPDDKDKHPKSKDAEAPVISANDKTVTEKTSFEIPVSVTDNDDSDAKVTDVSGLPKGVDYDETSGKISGSADQEDWSNDQDEVHTYPVTLKATDSSGNEGTKEITITVQRDSDSDGEPDVTDPDDDNDGLPDDKDKNPKSKDTEAPVISADDKTVTEKTPFEVPVSVTDNDDPEAKVTEITGLPKGVTYDSENGKISGSADQEDWSNDQDEVHTYPVTIKATDGAGNESTKEITITVQRDTDSDGTPDVNDPDDDNDGLPDDKDKNPKSKDTESPIISADDKTVTEKTPFEIPVSVTDNDDPEAGVTEVTGLPKGVDYDSDTGKISGSADQEDWPNDQNEVHTYPVTIKATDGAGNESTKEITITVQRDSDSDGEPDVTDPDDDNDGLPDDKDKNPKSKDSEGPVITADYKTVTEKTPFEIPVSVTDNDDPDAGVTEVTGLPKGVDYDSDTGKISGSADQENWSSDSDEVHTYPVTLKATDGSGNESTKEITITVQRDTDGDGTPDVNDSDDDNDGLPDNKDKHPKDKDTEGPVISADDKTVTEKTPFEIPVSVTDNDDSESKVTEITGLPKGVTYDSENGKISGSADQETWSGDSDEVHTYPVTIKATDGSGNESTKEITITVQRDTDSDGMPDVNDSDDDNDGLPDDKDKNPKSKDTEGPVITADDKTVTEKTIFEIPVSVTDNDDPEAKVTGVTGLPRGVDYSSDTGMISGSADQETWSSDSDEVHTYPVTLKATDGSGNESTKEITITVQRDSDGDGEPDVTDPDDDNDGLPDNKDNNPKSKDTEGPVITADDKTVTEKTSFEIPVSVTDNDDPDAKVIEVTGLPKGVDYDSDTGKISGSADQETWSSDSDEVHTYPVTIKAIDGSGNESTKQITITIQRDTDSDGMPDVNDSDDDNDNLPDDKDKNPKSKDTEGPVITAGDKTVTEKTPFEVPVSVMDNDDPDAKVTEVTGLPKGVDYSSDTGMISGSADQETWSGDSDEVHTYPVTIKATDGSGNEGTKEIIITVQRDSDGDGDPDVTDPDDDNDGLPDAKDKNPKSKDAEGPVITADDKTVTERTPFEVPVSVTDNDDPDAKITDVSGLPKGVDYDETSGKISGSADQEDWSGDSDEVHTYPVTIKATDDAGNEGTKEITITVQRDTDSDGTPDVNDPDDDNDGLPDDKDNNPKSEDTESPIISVDDKTVTEKTSFEIPVSVTDNDDPEAKVTEVTGLPKGVNFDEAGGKIAGSADQETWSGDTDEVHTYPVTLKATDGAGNESTKEITITVQRDTDGDSIPDVNDSDDDNDGLPDDKDKNPKSKDTEAPVISSNDKTVTEKTSFEIPVSVTDNDDPDAKVTDVSGLPKGVDYDETSGKISGSADQEDWSNDQDEAHTYPVTLKATDGAGNESTKEITITVQRDTDGDSIPDVNDSDDDNDGLPDDKDKNPKSKDTEAPVISSNDKTVTEKTSFEIPVSVTDNDDPDAKVTDVSGLPEGVTYDSASGKISGSADQETWSGDSDEVHTYPVTIKATDGSGNEGTKEITITVQRDTDGDGDPDVTDPDDDNDGIPDDKDKNPKSKDAEGPV